LACADAAKRGASHTLGVMHALKLGRNLNILPGNVWIYTVAGEDFGYGPGMSPPLEAAIEAVAQRVRSDITAWHRQREDDSA
jgi:hydrogenase maturation protease